MSDPYTRAEHLILTITRGSASAWHHMTNLDYETALAHVRQIQADAGVVADQLTMLHLRQEEGEGARGD